MEADIGYEFKIDNDTYLLKIQSNSSDKLLFTLKKNDDNELMYYKKELQYDELLKIFGLNSDKFPGIEKICEYLKKAKEKNRIKIKIENEKAKFILIKEVDFEEIEYPFDLDQCAIAGQELNKNIFKDLKEIKEQIKD